MENNCHFKRSRPSLLFSPLGPPALPCPIVLPLHNHVFPNEFTRCAESTKIEFPPRSSAEGRKDG